MDHQLLVSSRSSRRTVLFWLAATPWIGLSQQQDAKPKPIVYTLKDGVKPPKLIHYVEPAFTDTSKDAFVDGVVKLKTTVTPEGLPVDIEVVKGLSESEDRNAVDALKQWRFEPGTKDGEPVHVRVGVQIAFHLM